MAATAGISGNSSAAPPAALLAAAEVYVDQVHRRRNILLRQLQLHVNAYVRAEMSRATGNGGGISSPGGRAAAATAASGAGHALRSSVVRLAQQIRKEGVRLVEALQLVRTALGKMREQAKQQRADAAAAAAASSQSTVPAIPMPTSSVDVEALLGRMLADTDMVARSADLVGCTPYAPACQTKTELIDFRAVTAPMIVCPPA